MSELKTLSKSDPKFTSYLLGTFSKQQRALPVSSLNVNTDSETVTFQIVALSEIQAPPFFLKWLQILKVNNFTLVFLPICLVLAKCTLDEIVYDPILALLSALGAFSLHAAVNLRNDFLDHYSGLDRLFLEKETKTIQKGWLTASAAKKLSNVFIGLGLLLGAPSVAFYPELTIIVSALLVLGFIGMHSYRFGLRYRLWTEITAFLLLGPMLTVGYQMSIGAHFDFETILFGLLTGWFAVFILHLKNFRQIIIYGQAGFLNSITLLGFEKAKNLILFWWSGLVIGLAAYHLIYATTQWLLVFFAFSLLLSTLVFKAIRRIQSPVASNFNPMLLSLQKLAFILMCFWVFELMTLIVLTESQLLFAVNQIVQP